jgi:hypothetical protein
MVCSRVLKDKCSVGHVQSHKCGEAKPASCHKCEKDRKARERAQEQEFERQEKRDREQRSHDARIARLDEEIRLMREAMMDARRAEEMAQSLKQKEKDLEDAKKMRNGSSRRQQYSSQVTNLVDTAAEEPASLQRAYSSASKVQLAGTSPEVSAVNDSTSSPVNSGGNRVTLPPSPSEIEWERQKRLESASNDAIDALMSMTGLEEVKSQVLKIKAKIETASRQGIDLGKERLGLVLLGNPGTGELYIYHEILRSFSEC